MLRRGSPSVTDERLTRLGLSGYKDAAHAVAEGAALRPQWCCHCKVVILGSGVRKSFRDLAFANKVPGRSSSDPAARLC